MPPLPTDIRLDSVVFGYEDFNYRTPIKFGGIALDRVTILNVHANVRTVAGKSARGFGSMPLGNVWSFPSRVLNYDQTLAAMKALAERVCRLFAGCKETGHPIDLFHALEQDIFRAADAVSRELKLAEPIPQLCALVVASPFDAAVHDAFGKVHGRNCYQTYSREFLPRDLDHYLGPEYAGEHLERYVLPKAKPRMPLYHLIGALDPITDADIKQRINDGLPETLPEWIRADGLTHLKIKLNGDNLSWDVERVLQVDEAAAETQHERGVRQWHYSLDFNERCANVGYLLEFLARVKEQRPHGFERIQYIEQPTARDLKANRHNVMHEAAKLRPIVIDESLIDLESLKLAQELGYTGAALKACKGQSPTLLLAAAAQKAGLFLC
ncbi:MAG TPA: enolase C-terminal domain-like protein, partial [Gemmataceae bacterium]|nr:enolase C-terminal domain-like protein [Gemmataceae bacterium]